MIVEFIPKNIRAIHVIISGKSYQLDLEAYESELGEGETIEDFAAGLAEDLVYDRGLRMLKVIYDDAVQMIKASKIETVTFFSAKT